MTIYSATRPIYAGQRAPLSTAARNIAEALSTAPGTAGTSKSDGQGNRQADFTSMTRLEMLAWSNDQIRSGKMSLDDGRPFMAMAMKIPVGGGALQATDDGERLDFMQKVREGIEGALSRNDGVTGKMLESALNVMQQNQGETIGVDIRA